MKTTTLAIAAAMAAGTVAHAQEAVQRRVEDGGNGHWYVGVVRPSGVSFDTARADALAMGGDLGSLELQGENEWVFENVASAPALWVPQGSPTAGCCRFGPWIGGIQVAGSAEPSGGWTWVSGVALPDTWPGDYGPNNSCGGSSNENRLHYWGLSGPLDAWNDLPSTPTCGPLPRGFIVELSADCNGDGIVDYGQILDGTFEDANENGVPDCCDEGVSCDPCLGDVNNDGIVNGADISVLLGFWGLNGKPVAADINKDGSVDGADLAQLLGSWGECP